MIPIIYFPIAIGVIILPAFFGLLTESIGHTAFYSGVLLPLMILPAFFICLVGVVFGVIAYQAKKLRSFQLVLDKDTNKMTLYTPNPFIRSMNYSFYISRFGQYLTAAWDLDRVLFRLIMPGERAGPRTSFLRGLLKRSCLVMYGDQGWLRPNLLLASENVELAQSLISIIDTFLRGRTGFKNDQDGGLLSERPYFP